MMLEDLMEMRIFPGNFSGGMIDLRFQSQFNYTCKVDQRLWPGTAMSAQMSSDFNSCRREDLP